MGDALDLAEDAYVEWLAIHENGGCNCERDCEYSPLTVFRREVQDMALERDRTFGDELVAYLERRKKLGKAQQFFRKWKLRT